jgi:hypothetical protein
VDFSKLQCTYYNDSFRRGLKLEEGK